MSFQGDISSLSLCDVFQNLASNRKTGTLTMTAGEFEAHVQFEAGNVICYTDNAGFSIAKWLTDKQVVPVASMEEALKRYKRAKRKPLGNFLHDMGVLDGDEYKKYVNYFVTESLYELLSMQEGAFQFREGNLNPEHGNPEVRCLQLKISPASLMMEAARRTDDWEEIRRHMPSKNEIYWIKTSEREHRAAQTEDEKLQHTLPLLDGRMTLGQVIDRVPFSRFEACRCLASLIAAKKLRPIDSAKAVQRSTSDDPKQAIAFLKTILEREPNNRDVLEKLASLNRSLESFEDSARYYKLLGISFLEEGDLQHARKCISDSLSLNPKDMITWQKLRECVYREGKKEDIIAFGRKYVQNFTDLGLMELVRDHLEELVEQFPDEQALRTELADARFALGDHKTATQELIEFGNVLLKKSDYDTAEGVFAHVLKFDHNNERAKEICEQISTGRFEERKQFRRRMIDHVLVAICLLLGAFVIGREMFAQQKLFQVTRTVFAESILEERRYELAIEKLRELQEQYPYSYMTVYEVPALIEVLEEKRRASDESWPRREIIRPKDVDGSR